MNLTQSQLLLVNFPETNGRAPSLYLVMKDFNLSAMQAEFQPKYHGIVPENDVFLARMMSRGYLRKYPEGKLVLWDGLPT